MDAATRQDILDLISRYSYGYDDQDWDMFDSIWAEDAVWTISTMRFEGRTAIVDGLRSFREGRAADGFQTRHYQTNTLLSPAGDGFVKGSTLVLVAWQRAGEAAPTPVHTGVYRDEFVKTSAGWRFGSRLGELDHD